MDSQSAGTHVVSDGSILLEDRVGDLSIVVKHIAPRVSLRSHKLIDAIAFSEESAQKNLLKGLTADESVVVRVSTFMFLHISFIP